MKLRVFSDIHGNFERYIKLTQEADEEDINYTLQLGDMGVGFSDYRDNLLPKLDLRHGWFKGNHDNPNKCREHPNYVGDFGFWNKTFFVSGEFSPDYEYRTLGVDWWGDQEELIPSQMDKCLELYTEIKPDIVVSHGIPQSVILSNLDILKPIFPFNKPSNTQLFLDSLLETHNPKIWITGHWHVWMDTSFDNTRFLCAPPLEWWDIDLDQVEVLGNSKC